MFSWIDRLRQFTFLQIFTIYLRYLIGGAFVIAAFVMGKITSEPMLMAKAGRPIGELEPMQQFFRVMLESGLYWNFVGWTQIFAGVLLMTQKFAKLGAVIFFVLILNIFVITISYHFQGTPLVTGLMLLATVYLIVWDYQSFLALVKDNLVLNKTDLKVMDKAYWTWLGMIMIASITPLLILRLHMLVLLGVPFAEGLIGFIIFFAFFSPHSRATPLTG